MSLFLLDGKCFFDMQGIISNLLKSEKKAKKFSNQSFIAQILAYCKFSFGLNLNLISIRLVPSFVWFLICFFMDVS